MTKKQFSLGTLLLMIGLGSICFYCGWLSHATFRPRIQVNSNRVAPTTRGGGAGYVVVSIDVETAHDFQPGDNVAIDCQVEFPDGSTGQSTGGSYTVFEVGGGTISLLVHSDLQQHVVEQLRNKQDCRLIRATKQ